MTAFSSVRYLWKFAYKQVFHQSSLRAYKKIIISVLNIKVQYVDESSPDVERHCSKSC